jgi:hypothetical protein
MTLSMILVVMFPAFQFALFSFWFRNAAHKTLSAHSVVAWNRYSC